MSRVGQVDEQHDDLLERAVAALSRAPVPPGPPPEAVVQALAAAAQADAIPLTIIERIRKMKRIAQFAVAATALVAIGIFASWMIVGGGSGNMAFARVADALDSLRSATYDVTSESKGENGQPSATATGKGFFLAPSHQRMEILIKLDKNMQMNKVKLADSPAAKAAAEAVMNMPPMKQVTIFDGQAGKFIMLMPDMKIATAMDMKKMMEDMKKSDKSAKAPPPDQFEMVRRLVREGSSGTGAKTERLGKKEIDGREAVGFRTDANGMDMTLWADPETARPIRIEVGMDMLAGGRMVMSNFRYDVDLEPSMFRLEPPAGYSTQAMTMTMPVEEDLLRTLRTIAEHGNGIFPAKLGMNEEVMKALMPARNPAIDAEMNAEMNAAMNKIAAKYGGEDKLRAIIHGKERPSPEIMAELRKAMEPFTQKQIQKQMKTTTPDMQNMQKQMQGVTFYMMLKPQNDAHYVGGGVKLGTPDRPICWYKPTGAQKYRVIYADLSVKDLAPEDVKKLSEAKKK
jgi:outer membrane lipoprotein-sorting protein